MTDKLHFLFDRANSLQSYLIKIFNSNTYMHNNMQYLLTDEVLACSHQKGQDFHLSGGKLSCPVLDAHVLTLGVHTLSVEQSWLQNRIA